MRSSRTTSSSTFDGGRRASSSQLGRLCALAPPPCPRSAAACGAHAGLRAPAERGRPLRQPAAFRAAACRGRARPAAERGQRHVRALPSAARLLRAGCRRRGRATPALRGRGLGPSGCGASGSNALDARRAVARCRAGWAERGAPSARGRRRFHELRPRTTARGGAARGGAARRDGARGRAARRAAARLTARRACAPATSRERTLGARRTVARHLVAAPRRAARRATPAPRAARAARRTRRAARAAAADSAWRS